MAASKKTKKCRVCHRELSTIHFSVFVHSPDGLYFICKECTSFNKSMAKTIQQKKRKCLRCSKMFTSKSTENRICTPCKNVNANYVYDA